MDDQPGAEPRQDLDACRERAGDEPRGLAQVVQFVLVALLAAQLRAEDEQPRRPAGFPVAVRLLQRAPDEREPAAGIASAYLPSAVARAPAVEGDSATLAAGTVWQGMP